MWRTTEYRIEQLTMDGRTRCFLDAVQIDENGRTSTSNICNGDDSYCRREQSKLVKAIYDEGYIASEQAYPLADCPYPLWSKTAKVWKDGHEQATRDLCGANSLDSQ